MTAQEALKAALEIRPDPSIYVNVDYTVKQDPQDSHQTYYIFDCDGIVASSDNSWEQALAQLKASTDPLWPAEAPAEL